METLRIIITVVFIIVSIALAAIVLMQEGKNSGLSALSGVADTYWSKNKGRSMEGMLIRITTILGIVFVVMAILLNMSFF